MLHNNSADEIEVLDSKEDLTPELQELENEIIEDLELESAKQSELFIPLADEKDLTLEARERSPQELVTTVALQTAVRGDSLQEVRRLLVEAKANPDIPDAIGVTVLMRA